ncbi:hypothetical protein BASA81_004105 [Batrachochytrium salamandrivorans]|nr:hypothetical protein BASA81_004105 [Batrachochytrium salamandrivorans]
MMNSEPPDKHRSIKQSLKNVVRRPPRHSEPSSTLSHASHRITVHALQFLKLYLLSCFENGVKLPLVTEHLVVSIMNVLCEESERQESERQESGHQETRGRRCNSDTLLLKQKLLEFHREHYKLTMTDPKEKLGFTNKAQLLQYIAVDVVKDYENNLKLHFVQHLIRFLEFVYKKSEVMATGNKQARAKLFVDLRAARDFVLFQPKASSKRVRLSGPVEAPVMPPRLADHMKHIVPQRRFQEGSVHYDIQCSPQDYLPCVHDATSGLGAKYKLLKDIIGNKDAVWRSVFHLERKCFAPRRATSTSSPTPCRQTGSRARCCGTRRAPEKKKRLARKRELLALPKDLKRVRPEPSAKRAELYVAPTESSKRVVGVDPGKSDLIYCSSGTGPGDWFRYTQNQKRHETGEKKHRARGPRWQERSWRGRPWWIGRRSTFSRKALTVSAATAYFTKKNEVNARLFPHYEQEAYRVLKWRAFVNRRRSEDRMVNRFRDKFGGRGHAEVFLRAGYEVVLVDEFRTSCTCFACEGGACEKFRVVENPRPWMRAKRPMVLRHGLLRCKTCERLWNRDRNGSLNIMRCAQAARLGGQRPSYMTRNFSAARPAGTTQGAGLPTMVDTTLSAVNCKEVAHPQMGSKPPDQTHRSTKQSLVKVLRDPALQGKILDIVQSHLGSQQQPFCPPPRSQPFPLFSFPFPHTPLHPLPSAPAYLFVTPIWTKLKSKLGCGIVFLDSKSPTLTPSRKPIISPTPFKRYAISLSKQLENKACEFCAQNKSQFLLPIKSNFTFLTSFPGSGNNWVISQLSTGSKLHHCSVYNVSGAYASNFNFHQCIVTKTHYPFYSTSYDEVYRREQTVYLVRNPFDAILAELFRRQVQSHQIARYFGHFAKKWRHHMRYHVGKQFWNHTKRFHRVDTEGTVRFVNRNKLVVFYEDFRQNQAQSLRNLFTFLREGFHGLLPPVESSVTCALEMDQMGLGTQTTRGRSKRNFFAQPENARLTRKACQYWQGFWFEELWGPCMDAHGRYFSKDVLGYTHHRLPVRVFRRGSRTPRCFSKTAGVVKKHMSIKKKPTSTSSNAAESLAPVITLPAPSVNGSNSDLYHPREQRRGVLRAIVV